MNTSITQDMKYRQSLMQYAEKYGVSKASRKYNRCRSYIYFWRARWDGTIESLAEYSKRPHHHPNEHTEEELTLIRNMRRRNPTLGLPELWHRLKKKGYTRCIESLFRVLRKLNLSCTEVAPKPAYIPKPYESMTHPGERVQIDVKVVPRSCLANPEERLYQYTAIDEFSRLRYLGAYSEQSTWSSADFLKKAAAWFKRKGIVIECVQTDNGPEFTNRFTTYRDKPSLFDLTAASLGIRHKLIAPYMPRHNGKVERSHREDQRRFYKTHSFFSLDDFAKQLSAYLYRSNSRPMRPLSWLSPLEFLSSFLVQHH